MAVWPGLTPCGNESLDGVIADVIGLDDRPVVHHPQQLVVAARELPTEGEQQLRTPRVHETCTRLFEVRLHRRGSGHARCFRHRRRKQRELIHQRREQASDTGLVWSRAQHRKRLEVVGVSAKTFDVAAQSHSVARRDAAHFQP